MSRAGFLCVERYNSTFIRSAPPETITLEVVALIPCDPETRQRPKIFWTRALCPKKAAVGLARAIMGTSLQMRSSNQPSWRYSWSVMRRTHTSNERIPFRLR
jgi:hypothetical protein